MIDHVLKAADQKTSDGQKEVRVARILLYKIFYDHTDQGVLAFMIQLLRTFDLQKQPRRFALLAIWNFISCFRIT